jgi:hypothetical protein
MRCRRPFCKGRVMEGACLLCCRAPEGTTPEPLDIPVPVVRLTAKQRETQYGLLTYIGARPGLTTAEIARAFTLSHSAMKSRLDTLYTRHEVVKTGKGGLTDPHRWRLEEIEEEAS